MVASRPPLILLPGLLCDGALWQHQSQALADIADVSVADLTSQETIGAMASQVLAEAPEQFALAGLSMGGYVALEIIRQAPERVARLALVDTNARADSPQQSADRWALIGLARSGEFKGVTRRLLPLLVHRERVNDEQLANAIFAMAERVGRDAFIRQQRAIMGRPDSRRDLGLIHCPTVVLCGRQDLLTPLAMATEMAEKIRRAVLVAIEECGHLAALEQPQAVSAVLRYWLQT
ncbi:MAG: alpha/beta hydrolase [Rhodospirillales bacterium]|nr:alpha/beta hydrolase [Rhodospirillales bacterium]MDG4603275.1 alpha/beta hydrolase [Defluviicoccus sp.]MDG4609798.1 alpha/beta hydrolase [Defluviicoccus sp.]HOT82868.1 alpha/beta hydrolase [Candidatus Defluviicoccus seviourii]